MPVIRRASIALSLAGVIAAEASGAVVFTQVPRTLQLYGRDLTSDSGTVVISGSAPGYASVAVCRYRNDVLLDRTECILGDSAGFSLALKIKAEPALYRFTVSGSNGSTDDSLASADSVVCGDVFIIQGQSNAVATMGDGSADGIRSPFIRVFGSGNPDQFDSTWHVAQGDGDEWSAGNAGQWGLRFARNIVDNQNIPVAIFNGARGGRALPVFQRNDTNASSMTTNYGRLLTRLRMTGLGEFVRAIAWNQGEADMTGGGQAATALYQSRFQELRNDWLTDYPGVKKIYSFQLTPGVNCASVDNAGPVKEAQRRIPLEIPGVEALSTSGCDHYDACHYPYVNGFERFGNDLYRLVARDLYGGSITGNIEPPAIQSAELTDSLHITLTMRNTGDSLIWNPGSQKSFRLEGVDTAVKVIAGHVEKNRVILTLSAIPVGLVAITYKGDAFPDSLGHAYRADPLVRNLNGVGALHFYMFPVGSSAVRRAPVTAFRGRTAPSSIVALRRGARRGFFLTGDSAGAHVVAADGRIVRAGNSGERFSHPWIAAGTYAIVKAGNR